MACVENRASGTVICLGLLVFATSLCHCTKMTRLKALDEKRGNVAHTQSKAGRSHQHHGRLLIGQNSQQAAKLNGTNSTESMLDVVTDYQADMGWWQTKKLHDYNDWPKSDIEATQRLLDSESKVECTQSSMKLLVHDAGFTPAALIFVDRGHLSPLSLAKLPSSCGYTIRSTQSSLVLVAPYDGCFVIVEENSYVLPLRWWGLPVKMSCPMILSSNPPMVTCHAEGMVVQTEWTSSASDIKANVDGNWEPLLTSAHRCAFGVVEHPDGVVISVRYAPCLRKMDGFYTLELAADKETKISCPTLLAAHIKPTKDLTNGPVQQSEKPSDWLSPLPNPLLAPRSGPTRSQIPDFPQSPEKPSKPNQVPKEFDPVLSYSLFHPRATNPETTQTKQPYIHTPTRFAVPKNAEKGSQHFPFYQSPVLLPTLSPVTKPLPQKQEVEPLQYQFNLPKFPQKPTEPPSSYPKGQEQRHLDPPYDTQTSPPSYPLYLEKVPEKPEKLHPTMSEKFQDIGNLPIYLICTQQTSSNVGGASQGQISQPFYLLCTQMKLFLKNAASHQPQPEILQDQQNHPFSLSCTQQTQASDPTMSQGPYPESYLGQIYQSFYLSCTQLRPSSQPTGVTWPQHEATQSHRYQAFFPYSSQPNSKPAVTQPLQPTSPQGQEYQQHFPFYTQPKPTQKPVTKPQEPVLSQSQLNQQFFHVFTRPNPKPADFTQPPLPATPPNQVYQAVLGSLTQQNPSPKPDCITESPQPATPEDQVYQPIFHFYSQQKQSPKPAVNQPPKPAAPQGQYQPLLDYLTQLKQTPKPAVTQPPQPSTLQSQVYKQPFYFLSKPKLTSNPTVSQPPPMDISQGHQPLYHLQKPESQLGLKPSNSQPAAARVQIYQSYPFQSYTRPKSDKTLTPVSQQSQPGILQGKAHQQMCLYNQLLTKNQLAKMPTEIILGKVYGPCQISLKVGAETSSFLNPSSHVQPAYCPRPCPSGLTNCLQIAFHQHLHISPGQDGKHVPKFNMNQPFSQAVYPDVSGGLEGGSIPQKHLEAAILQSSRDRTPTQISPLWAPLPAGRKQEYFQPPDGNPAALPRSSRIKTASQLQVYPYFITGSSNPYWSTLPQHFGLLNLQQRKSEGSGYPSDSQASGGKWLEPVEQRELFNIDFPQQQNSQFTAGHVHSRPNFMPYINQHGSYTTGQQNEPDIEQSLHQSEFKSSTHNFKRALDQFFSPHYMPQDAPNSNHSNSKVSNNSRAQLNQNNSTKPNQPLLFYSGSQRYVPLQHGLQSKPISFSDHQVDSRNLVRGAKSKMKYFPEYQSSNQNSEQEESQLLKSPEEEALNPLLEDVNYMQRLDDKLDVPLFSSALDDSDLEYLPSEQYFSATQLKPEVLESFEELWESMSPSDSSQLFAAQVPNKKTSAADQNAEGMNRPLKRDTGNQNRKEDAFK